MSIVSLERNPLLLPEIARLVCDFIDDQDLLNAACTCRVWFDVATRRIWKTLCPQSHMTLRKLRGTLEGRYGSKRGEIYCDYRHLVSAFRWCPRDKEITPFERSFFQVFSFPKLVRLEFSYAAAQDHAVQQIIAASPRLRHVDLSHCYCLSTEAIRPLLFMEANRLQTLVLYGCGKIDHDALAAVIARHRQSLSCIRLTNINGRIMEAIQSCPKLSDLGLEHSDSLDHDHIVNFFHALKQQQKIRLTRVRMRDVANLSAAPMYDLALAAAHSLTHLDMSECNSVSVQGFEHIARQCTCLETLLLVYQSCVTDATVQLFLCNCSKLKHLDVSGCRLLTDNAFRPLVDGTVDLDMCALEMLNVSGLEPDLSPSIVLHLLKHLPRITELCLGVAYDLTVALRLLDQANNNSNESRHFSLDIDKCHTIHSIYPKRNLNIQNIAL